jgi:hypothetical protein
MTPDSLGAKAVRRTLPWLRWWIGGLLFASTVINYIDRQTLSVLAPFLKAEHHWTDADYASILLSFRLAYYDDAIRVGAASGPLGDATRIDPDGRFLFDCGGVDVPGSGARRLPRIPVPARFRPSRKLGRRHQGRFGMVPGA